MLLRRHKANYNDGWFSTEELDCILREVGRSVCVTVRCNLQVEMRYVTIICT